MTDIELASLIDAAFERRAELGPRNVPVEIHDALERALSMLDTGKARVAEKRAGRWHLNEWLKKAVLLSFRIHDNQPFDAGYTQFFDKVALKYSDYDAARFRADGVRVVPSALVRRAHTSHPAPC